MSWIDYDKAIKKWVEEQELKASQAFLDAPEDSVEEDYQLGRKEAFSEVLEKLDELSNLAQ